MIATTGCRAARRAEVSVIRAAATLLAGAVDHRDITDVRRRAALTVWDALLWIAVRHVAIAMVRSIFSLGPDTALIKTAPLGFHLHVLAA